MKKISNNTYKISLLAIVAIVLTMSSCKKEEVDITAPEITIEEPTMHMYTIDTASTSVEVPIKVTATDNESLHELVVIVENTTDGSEILHIHLHPDVATASVDTMLTLSYTSMKDHTLTVTAKDHTDNSSSDTKDFHVHVD